MKSIQSHGCVIFSLGALLVVDAAQGVEAQTLANVYLALDNNLEIIPVLNKIDLPAADPERVRQEIEETIGLDCSDVVMASAKSGIGITDILESIVKKVPPPPAETSGPLRALIFDSYYDAYRGVVVFFRVVDGAISKGDKVRFLNSEAEHEVAEVGVMTPNQIPVETLRAGEVGYMWGNIKVRCLAVVMNRQKHRHLEHFSQQMFRMSWTLLLETR